MCNTIRILCWKTIYSRFNFPQMDSSSPDSYSHWESYRDTSRSSQNNDMPRSRLFKTRAETKRKPSKDEYKKLEVQTKPQPSNLHRSMSSPQFQVCKVTYMHIILFLLINYSILFLAYKIVFNVIIMY